MSQLTQEIQTIFGTVVPKKAIYKMKKSTGWRGDSISFKNETSNTSNSDSFLKDDVLGRVQCKIDFSTGTVTKGLDISINRRMRDDMLQQLVTFICSYSGYANPRLTTFYKWYKAVDGNYQHIYGQLDIDEADKFEDLLFNVWKYTKTACHTTDQRKNAIKILEFIHAKYENQLKELI